jgi:hypothetical protein
MLRERDRILRVWDTLSHNIAKRWHIYGMSMKKVDDERKAIRCKLKSLGSSR